MKHYLYTFVGCTAALQHYLQASTAADKETAQTACAALSAVAESLLDAAVSVSESDTSEEAFKEIFSSHVITVLESIEALRSTVAGQGLNDTLLSLLDYFYAAADNMAGGGGGLPWPPSNNNPK